MSDEKSRDQRLAEHEAKQKARADEEKKRRELVEDLEMRFDAELDGPRGKAFEIIETADGPIVVAPLEQMVTFKKFSESKKTSADIENFVRPHVKHPAAIDYMRMIDSRPVYAVRCANALFTLYGGKSDEEAGKF